MKNVLVTGAAGFIGANFVRRLALNSDGMRIVGLDSLTYAGNGKSLEGIADDKFIFVHGDIRNLDLVERLMAENEIDTLVHFAAESHVDRSIEGPDAFLSTNIDGTHSLLKAAKNHWLRGDGQPHRFHHVSTDEVYGSLKPGDAPFAETNQYQPNSPYSASKAASDHLVRAYHHTFGLEVVTSNCSNNYGPFQFPEKLIPLMIVNVLHGRPLPIYGDGMQVRDWLYVEDHCRAIERCIEQGEPGQVYNIGGNNERPNMEIVNAICEVLQSSVQASDQLKEAFPNCPASKSESNLGLIEYVADRPGHDRRYAIDFTKAQNDIGYEPVETFETGFAKTVQWYLANQAWWDSVMDGSYRNWISTNYTAR
jgi:dTDP-glucose 4,6-dehydratase